MPFTLSSLELGDVIEFFDLSEEVGLVLDRAKFVVLGDGDLPVCLMCYGGNDKTQIHIVQPLGCLPPHQAVLDAIVNGQLFREGEIEPETWLLFVEYTLSGWKSVTAFTPDFTVTRNEQIIYDSSKNEP